MESETQPENPLETLEEKPGSRPRLLLLALIGLVSAAALLGILGGRFPVSSRMPPPPTPAPSVAPAPVPVRGQILEAPAGTPIARAIVRGGEREVVSDAEGRFDLGSLPVGTALTVKAPGFRRVTLTVSGGGPKDIRLNPFITKGIYLTFYGVGDREIRSRILALIERTELNAAIIDVKGDRGMIPYPTQVPLALEAGANRIVTVKNIEELMATLKARGIYTVARIDVYKDTVLAHHKPEWAVRDTRTGRPWLDNERLAWIDPFREEAWDYTLDIAREAVAKGFDEIQFDYIRFPTDGTLSAIQYSKENTEVNRVAAIEGFLRRAREVLGPTGVFIATDLFGYVAFNENDTKIGQRVDMVSRYVDYISPMAYPSGYHLGIPGYRYSVAHPYPIVRETIKKTIERLERKHVKVRPWIQDFRDYAFDRRTYGPHEIRLQMKAAMDAGARGWMIWNPKNQYTAEALAPKEADVASRGGSARQ
jgi:hypothetical protein